MEGSGTATVGIEAFQGTLAITGVSDFFTGFWSKLGEFVRNFYTSVVSSMYQNRNRLILNRLIFMARILLSNGVSMLLGK